MLWLPSKADFIGMSHPCSTSMAQRVHPHMGEGPLPMLWGRELLAQHRKPLAEITVLPAGAEAAQPGQALSSGG